ncbi:MAG: CoB--CoM heterodisulfide reductase iron-sulfur subunit B family protein [Deltaproteobacteria bacterium]|nr:CoB--CoM heterodisulfide reductase iron-sulfur subunit B family protein [Deltaproteobacteria bacterium]
MKYAFFLGCTVPVRNLNYELASRRVAERLGITLVDLGDFQCCGFPMKSISFFDSLVIAARNLALAERENLPVCTLCSACGGSLSEAGHLLRHSPSLREQVNERLRVLNLEYEGRTEVKHFMRVLHEDVGLEKIAEQVVRPLTGFSFAPHYGCHYLKPAEAVGGLDPVEDPFTLTRLIEVTGAASLQYNSLLQCCGGGVLGAKEDLANTLAGEKLGELSRAGVTGLVLVCPFCNVMFEGQQKKIEKKLEQKLKVPVLYYPQLLGLALGFSPDELGFKLNRVKDKEFLKRMEAA